MGITAEPALLSGSVTIVGKIIYSAPGGRTYIDYPTIGGFGSALVNAGTRFLDSLGVCAKTPPPETRSHRGGHPKAAPHHGRPRRTGSRHPNVSCTSRRRTLDAVTESVTFTPPLIVVLPLAIYQ
jgi:hypothetical protein